MIYGTKWSGTVTFGFPGSRSSYPSRYADGEADSGFKSLTNAQRDTINYALAQVGRVTNLKVQYSTDDAADIRVAVSNYPDTSLAYMPSNASDGRGGDIWIGPGYENPVHGNYEWFTLMHEVLHAIGLKDISVTAPLVATTLYPFYDEIEYTVMSYNSFREVGSGSLYRNEQYGYPTTYGPLDMAAIQYLYGPNWSTESGNTHYYFDPASGHMNINGVWEGLYSSPSRVIRVFETVWDGGGEDTYDFSAYVTDQEISLEPGDHSILSKAQLADLGGHLADGNVHNAFLPGGDTRALIENAEAGSGADNITGNVADNKLWGNAGSDTIRGLDGADTVFGGDGADDVNGNAGVDSVSGGDGADFVRGGRDNDVVHGDGGGDPHVNGNLGDDTVFGDAGDDTVFGGQGDDLLYGGDGADRLSGDLGADSLVGGPGADRFVLRPGSGADRVLDFEGQDHVLLSPGAAYTVGTAGGWAAVVLESGDKMILQGITAQSFNADWIAFG